MGPLMTKSNPFAKARTIVVNVLVWTLGGIAAAGFLAILVASIWRGFAEGLPWYDTFAFPLMLVGMAIAMLVITVLCLFIASWWRDLEHNWDRKHRG